MLRTVLAAGLILAFSGCENGVITAEDNKTSTDDTTATLTWAPNLEADVAGYMVYYGTASGDYTVMEDVGLTDTPDAPEYTVVDLAEGNTYYFSVAAYDTSGNESNFSNEVSKSIF